MKRIIYTTFAILPLFLASCNNENKDNMTGSLSGAYIGFGSVNVETPLTKADGATKFTSKIVDEENGFDLEVISTKVPMETYLDETKATEVTRDFFKTNSFWIDGFLGDEIDYASKALPADKADHHFIKKAEVVKDGEIEENNGYHDSDKVRWKFKDAEYKWRDEINHYFWAYYPQIATFKSIDADNVSFDYTTDYTKDLVLAHHEQYWEDGHCPHTGGSETYYDELKTLEFNHLLSEVTVNFQTTSDPEVAKTGNYILLRQKNEDGTIDTDFRKRAKDGGRDDIPRGQINYVKLINYPTGNYSSESGWSIPSTAKVDMPEVNNAVSSFLIPQPIAIANNESHGTPTSGTEKYATIEINITDNHLQTTSSRFIGFPVDLSIAKNVTAWESGFKQIYDYVGTITFPYVPGGQEGYDPHFFGQPNELALPFTKINFDHLKTIRLSWDKMPYCNSNGLILYIAISKTEISATKELNKGVEIMKVTDEVAFNNVAQGVSSLVLYEMRDKNNVYGFWDKGQDMKISTNGVYEKPKYITNLNNVNYSGKDHGILIDNIDVSNLTGEQYIYILYSGGNNSNCEWTLQNFKLEILEYM